MLPGTFLPVVGRPHELAADLDGLLIGIRHHAAEEITKVLRARLVADLFGGIDVDLFQPLGGFNQSAQVHVGMAVGRGPDHALGAAGAGEPYVGPGGLHGFHPRVNHPVLEIFALVTERARFCPTLDDQVVGLLEPVEVFSWVLAGKQCLYGGAAHESRDYPAA